MRHVSKNRAVGAALLLSAIGAGAGAGFSAFGQDGVLRPAPAGERFLGHLATDKPLYRPGETVFGRCALLEAFTRSPSASPTFVQFSVHGPRGDTVFTQPTATASGVAAFAWAIPVDSAGGEYKLVASFPRDGFPSTEIAFDVRAYRVPRIDTDLEFERKAYGPGDSVAARLWAKRAEGGIPAGAKVTAVATVDSVEVARIPTSLDASGACTVSFRLPGTIATGDGTLALIIEDGGVQETAAKTIPIVLNKVLLEVFPEGGDLVSGLETRLYFEARTPRGKPADVAGRIVDASGVEVGRFRSEHEGRGRARFTPKRENGPYALVLDEPAGIKDRFALPTVQPSGFVITSTSDVTSQGAALEFKVASTESGKARVALWIRDKEIASLPVELTAFEPWTLTLTPPSSTDGVLRVTVYDASDTPRAERLVFRRPIHSLNLDVAATPSRGALRDHVKVTIKTRDEKGAPVSAVVTLAAVDDAVLETVEKRERAPRLPVEVLLGSEVRELRDATAYLETGPLAAARTDLLLGTQGWRRFAFLEPVAFAAKNGDLGARALAWRNPAAVLDPSERMIDDGEFFQNEFDGREFAPRAAQAPRTGTVLRGRVVEKQKADAHKAAATSVGALKAEKPPAPPPSPAAAPAADKDVGILAGDRMGRDEAAKKIVAGEFARRRAWLVPVVREFAHHALASSQGERTDFAETLYWNAGVTTNEKGEATVEFDLSDSITTFRVRADGFGSNGSLGAGDATIEARRPFYCEPKLPLEVTTGDRIDLPIAFVNGTNARLTAGALLTTGPMLATASHGWNTERVSLDADGRARTVFPLVVGAGNGVVSVRCQAQAGDSGFSDDVIRTIRVVPAGFPRELHLGGRLGEKTTHTIEIPEGLLAGSLETDAIVYPSPLASLEQAVAALLQEPCGCFEQTSSSNYPNVMVLQYLATHPGASPEICERARQLLDKGYKRLVSFECADHGYEWFGQNPGHEGLTAYGLFEFADMARVYSVDPAMMARTRDWLLAARDGKGGFHRNARALHAWGGVPEDMLNAYITWALVATNVPGVEKEIASVREQARSSEDPYTLALAANVLLDAKDPEAPAVLARLAKLQEPDGAFRRAKTSITCSGGESLEVETTSLAVLALLRAPAATDTCERAMQWLLERAKGGRFGSTQATVLALKAILAYDAAHATPKKAGTILLMVDGKAYDERPFSAEQQGPIVLPAFGEALGPGSHKLELALKEGTPMPYSITVRYHAITPASSERCQVSLATKLARTEIAEGEALDVAVELANKTDAGLPMTMAIVGLPGGLEARVDQLKELVKMGKIDFFELRGRDVVLYRRGMAPGEKLSLVISCVAAIPGKYTGQASRAYLYYTDEDKCWVAPLEVTIRERR
jgi:uncharacterized protein YfaS (alpha-2-macroglobulin family)